MNEMDWCHIALLGIAACSADGKTPGTEPIDASDMPPVTVNVDGGGSGGAGPTVSDSGGRDTSTPDAGDAGQKATADAAVAALHYAGVNLSGAEFGGALPGVNGKDYQFPNHS